jgi:hypothetical protein
MEVFSEEPGLRDSAMINRQFFGYHILTQTHLSNDQLGWLGGLDTVAGIHFFTNNIKQHPQQDSWAWWH